MKNRKVNNKKEVDFNSADLKQITGLISDMMKDIDGEDRKADLSKVDQKFLDMLAANSDNKSYADIHNSLSKKIQKENKNSTNSSFLSFWTPAWTNFAIVASMALLLISAGASSYFWPSEGNEVQEMALESDTQLAQANVYMKPEIVTNSGYVDSESSFVFEVDAPVEGDLEETFSIEPAVAMNYSYEEKDGKTFMTADPQEELRNDTEYKIHMSSTFIGDQEWVVIVEPALQVASSSPKFGSRRVDPKSAVSITFNHKNVKLEDFLQNISVKPEIIGEWYQYGPEMVFIPSKGFQPGIEYVFSLSNNMQNDEGEKMTDIYQLTFQTSESFADETSISPIRWIDHPDVEVLNMSEKVVTRAVSSLTDQIEYDLYRVSKDNISAILEEYLDDGTITLPENAELVNEQTLSSDQYYQYGESLNGEIFVVRATSDGRSIDRLITMSSVAPVAVGSKAGVEGWIVPLNDQVDLKSIKMFGVKGENRTDISLDEELYFESKLVDYLLIEVGDAVAIWIPGTDMEDSVDTSEAIILDNVKVSTNSPIAKQGEIVKYHVYLGDHLNRNTLLTDYSNLRVSIQNVNIGDQKALASEILSQELTVDPQTLTAYGEFKIPTQLRSGFLRIVVMNGTTELGSKLVKVSEKPLIDVEGNLTVNKDHLMIGESVMLEVRGEEEKEYNIRVFTGTVESSKIIQNLTNKNLIGSGNNELYIRTIQTDKEGRANWNFTPYGLVSDSPYQVYTFILESPEDPYAPIVVRNVLVANTRTIFNSELSENSFQTTADVVKVRLSSLDSLSGQIMAEEKFDIEKVLVKYAISSDGKVIQTQISPDGNISGVTNTEGNYELSLDKPEAGTYYLYMISDGSRYHVTSFDVYSSEMLESLKSAAIPPLSISARASTSSEGVQLFIPKLDNSKEYARLFTYKGEGEDLTELSSDAVTQTGGIVNLDLENKPATESSFCYYYPENSQLRGGCQKYYLAR